MSDQFQRVVVTKFDAADAVNQLSVITEAIPTPGDNEVLVKMLCRAVNPADMFSIMGVYPGFQPAQLPATPGLEGMGVIAKVGSAVKNVKEGDRVVPFLSPGKDTHGSYTEYLTISSGEVIKVPDSITNEQAAQAITNPVTAIGMLESVGVKEGDFVLQAAGGSTLGKQLIQICKHRGIKSISTVRREAQVEELKKYGADHVIAIGDGQEGTLAAKVMEITGGKGAYGAIDPVAGAMTAALQDSVREGGKVLVYGALGGLEYKGSVVSTLFRGVVTTSYWINRDFGALTPEGRQTRAAEVLKLMTDGVLTPHSGKMFPLAQAKDAMADSVRAGRSSDGKTFLITEA